LSSWFSTIARWTADQCGSSYAFIIAVAIVLVWAITGPIFAYSDTWQLIINTGTTVVTFWLVFIIQHTQNRDTLAIQIKLDELLRATKDASDRMIQVEDLTDEQLKIIRAAEHPKR
jgi:Predicted small integral membrane protein